MMNMLHFLSSIAVFGSLLRFCYTLTQYLLLITIVIHPFLLITKKNLWISEYKIKWEAEILCVLTYNLESTMIMKKLRSCCESVVLQLCWYLQM